WRGRTVPESSPRAALAAGAPAQPWRRQRRTAAGHCAVKLITRTRDPFLAVDQRVRTDFVVDVGDVDLRRAPPLPGLGDIAGPDAPCGTVSEFHQMASIVSFDLHRRSPV